MKVYCLGYQDKETDQIADCAFESTVRSYKQIADNPNWSAVTLFSKARRLIDSELAVFGQCIVCEEMELDIES